MTAKAYLARHGGHLSAVLACGVLAAGATLTAAKADIAPVAPVRQTLSQSIMSARIAKPGRHTARRSTMAPSRAVNPLALR
jgi:hypothetical protein